MKNTRENIKNGQNGITLIALVITIIVIFIITGISITMISGEHSIMGDAKTAKDETQNAEVKDIVKLAYTAAVMKNSLNGTEVKVAFTEELASYGYEVQYTDSSEDNYLDFENKKVTINGKEYSFGDTQ